MPVQTSAFDALSASDADLVEHYELACAVMNLDYPEQSQPPYQPHLGIRDHVQYGRARSRDGRAGQAVARRHHRSTLTDGARAAGQRRGGMTIMTVQPGGPGGPVLPVSVFVLAGPQLGGAGKVVFQELLGITSELESTPYISTTPAGGTDIMHTKQFGRTLPATVQLKRGMDGDASLWKWHQLALAGEDSARIDVELEMYSGPDFEAGRPPMATWMMRNAWVAKIDLAGVRAGSSSVVYETVQIVCDTIVPTKL